MGVVSRERRDGEREAIKRHEEKDMERVTGGGGGGRGAG